ncbi:MAG: DNA mismatch repair endonuclease MutL [Bacteroidales bacterium]|nr:DNA mismatch repair endonuclease MutL [Bacteroidales bacterium]
MTDIIKLLPDSVANQIAAGEVIQRPASAVKELLENAIDSGATQIDLIVKEAGKTLIQVIDNGCGMSETDARMSFERHATSKIQKADDLFAIRTMGFRGEALASIAAIAQVEIKTKRSDDELGTLINIEGSVVKNQSAVAMNNGTQIAVKNLFFNVPARRNFLKSNPAEMRHIVEEFHRISLMHPGVAFNLISNEKQIFHLNAGNLKQRIVGLFGNAYNERLLPVSQESDTVSIHGFIGKAVFAKKTRGEQYFFVNNRFIRHPYLHHAIENAFQELLPKDSFPTYFLNIQIDPAEVDINIHPTKTEVNFQDTKLIYAVLHAAVKKTIGQHNLAPMIDFDEPTDVPIDFGEISRANRPITPPSIEIDQSFNPFHQFESQDFKFKSRSAGKSPGNWRVLYSDEEQLNPENETDAKGQTTLNKQSDVADLPGNTRLIQLRQRFIVTAIRSGLMLIDQHLAHWRILYEKFLKQLEHGQQGSQQELFPQQIRLNSEDAAILMEIIQDLAILGYQINPVSSNTFVINGTPDGMKDKDIQKLIEQMLEQFKRNAIDLQLHKKLNLARTMSAQTAVKYGQLLNEQEMTALIDQLFACQVPEVSPDGRKIIVTLPLDQLQQLFK